MVLAVAIRAPICVAFMVLIAAILRTTLCMALYQQGKINQAELKRAARKLKIDKEGGLSTISIGLGQPARGL